MPSPYYPFMSLTGDKEAKKQTKKNHAWSQVIRYPILPEFHPITSSRYYSLSKRRKRLEAIGWNSGYLQPWKMQINVNRIKKSHDKVFQISLFQLIFTGWILAPEESLIWKNRFPHSAKSSLWTLQDLITCLYPKIFRNFNRSERRQYKPQNRTVNINLYRN